MLNCPINQREDQLKDLENFTKKIHQELMDITSTLGWTIEKTENLSDNRLVCPYDSSHQVGKKMLDQHLESCQWKQEDYNEFDIPLPVSNLSLDSYSSIKLSSKLQNGILQEEKKKDPALQIASYESPTWHKLYLFTKHEFLTLMIGVGERLIPRTSNRIFTDFTRDERRVLYEYAISNTVKPDIGHDDITDIQQSKSEGSKDEKKLSFLDVLIQERNLKRRRAKHRGVHTNKKSHTEILREVIHQQMELYTDYIMDTRAPKDSQEYNESSSSRNNGKEEYEEFDSAHACPEKHLEGQEKPSRSRSKSHKSQKHRKHKRSRSRERKHRDRESKHGSMRSHHKRKHARSYDYEEPYDSNACFRQSQEKLIS